MSNIGRKPIALGSVTVEVKGNEVHYKGPKASGIYVVPPELSVIVQDKKLILDVREEKRGIKEIWGLHRALLANALAGATQEFKRQLKIVGLGYKATVQGSKVQLSLGFSHKIEKELPKNVQLEVDKTGQLLTFKSTDKILLGQVCSHIRALRPPEPYKGTGIQYADERIHRKAGKTKSA